MGICEMHKTFGQKTCKEKDHMEDLGVDERMIKWVSKVTGCEDVDWIHLAQDGDHGPTHMGTVMHLETP
jgi:hypothetical protein